MKTTKFETIQLRISYLFLMTGICGLLTVIIELFTVVIGKITPDKYRLTIIFMSILIAFLVKIFISFYGSSRRIIDEIEKQFIDRTKMDEAVAEVKKNRNTN